MTSLRCECGDCEEELPEHVVYDDRGDDSANDRYLVLPGHAIAGALMIREGRGFLVLAKALAEVPDGE
jgi:hypothetical protein